MAKVAYMWSDFPQMAELALDLRESVGWEPVLWLGWGHLREPVNTAFPDVPWQWLGDAWFGCPIAGVSTGQPPALDAALWSRLQQYMPRLMDQMNRFGPPDVFLHDERQAFARDLLLRWHEVLSKTGAEIAFWEESPSVPFSYAAYVVCLELGIRTVALIPTRAWGLSLLKERIEEPPMGLEEAYRDRCQSPGSADVIQSVEQAVLSVTGHDIFRHRTELALAVAEGKRGEQRAEAVAPGGESESSDEPSVLERSVAGLRERGVKGFLAPIVSEVPLGRWLLQRRQQHDPVYIPFKLAGVRFDGDHGTQGDLRRYAARSLEIKRQLREDYERRCAPPDTADDKYVYFPLHYRPERVSNPDGGVFYDQFIALAMLSEGLPEGWKLYVKEHETQFYGTMYGECGRTKDQYDDIARLRGVQFIAATVPSKRLVLHSQAVASVSGTACWEAALLGRPAMYFGFPWYEGCPGTTRVSSASEVRAILDDPASAVANQGELHDWHLALGDAGFPYEFNAWQAEPGYFTDQEQYDGLRTALEWWDQHRRVGSE